MSVVEQEVGGMTESDRDPGLRIAIPCACGGCRRTVAYVVVTDGRLAIEIVGRHSNQQHTTVLRWGDLPATLDAERAPPSG